MRLTLPALLAAVTLLASPALALEAPQPSKAKGTDARMMTLTYRRGEVYDIHMSVGRTLAITVSQDERITDAWGSDSSAFPKGTTTLTDNTAILKAVHPITPRPFFVRTLDAKGQPHIYPFQLEVTEGDDGTVPYAITFTYPSRDAAARAAAWRAARAKREEEQAQRLIATTPQVGTNFAYVLQGETAADWNLLPTREVSDDGQSTFFHFPGSMAVPVVYVVGPDGKEAVVDSTWNVQTRVLTVHQIAPQFRIRGQGDATLCVFNRRYNPVGPTNTTRTARPDVVRELKD